MAGYRGWGASVVCRFTATESASPPKRKGYMERRSSGKRVKKIRG